jgi:hypothetical protein
VLLLNAHFTVPIACKTLVADVGIGYFVQVVGKPMFGRGTLRTILQVPSTSSAVFPHAAMRWVAVSELNPHLTPFIDTIML